MMKKLLLLSFLPLLAAHVYSQQVESFSLLRENSFTLNPALAGMQGWIHGTVTGRKQFSKLDGAPYTAMLAMNGQIEGKNVGIGGYLIHDVTGPTSKSAITISAAYNIQLYRARAARYSSKRSDHILSVGISISAVQYRLRGDQLLVNDANDPDLYTTKGFKIYPDLSFGIYYRYKNNFYLGASAPQLMGLNIDYVGSDGIARIKKIQHLYLLIGGKIEWARGNFSIDPVAAFRWVKGAPPQGDVGLRFMAYKVFWVGATYRSRHYMVFDAGFNIKDKFSVLYAYDMNLNNYRRDIGSTHEISLNFDISRAQRVWRGKGPALRF
jgi:type IX secretion system PorP/SprF family membrane protein